MNAQITPVPREARPYQGGKAGLVTRLIACTVDALSVGVAIIATYVGYNALLFTIHPRGFELTGASGGMILSTALLVLVLYLTIAWSTTGRTYGDHVMGLRVVGRRDGRVPPPKALARAVLCVGFPIGLLWCAASASRRSLQDALLRTSVIYDWRPRHLGEQPDGLPQGG